MRWDEDDENDRRVVDCGGWYDIRDILDKFPKRAGVYVFVNAALHVKYVGKAGAGRLRVEATNARDQRNKGAGATQAGWLATNSDSMALSLESELIEKYDPPNNLT